MKSFDPEILHNLYIPAPDSHKGMNGKLMIIGGSRLFHAASLWALQIASRIVDMVFYSSVDENNQIVEKLKEEFRNGIIVPRGKVDDYMEEADAILIGPGLPRADGQETGDDDTKELTERLLKKYPHKKWVIDGGSLQTIEPEYIPRNAILTPHPKEFEIIKRKVKSEKLKTTDQLQEQTQIFAEEYKCIVLLKGEKDSVSNGSETVEVLGGNAGMTKGGTGDVLAGLVAALATKNEPFLAAQAGSYINKKAGEALFSTMGLYFNASDLALEIPHTMKDLLQQS